MNAVVDTPVLHAQRLAEHINTATARIAPTWPLDEFIAVNPYWGWVAKPMPEAAAALGTLGGTRLTMPRDWFRAQWAAGRLQPQHLQAAVAAESPRAAWIDDAQAPAAQIAKAAELANAAEPEQAEQAKQAAQVAELVADLQGASPPLSRLPLITDLRDRAGSPRPGLSWADLVTHQVSQHCAAYFDRHQAAWAMDHTQSLFDSWRQHLAADHGLAWRHGHAALRQQLAGLPSDPQAVVAAALDGLGIPEEGRQAYLSATLMAIGGWAAWCAYERWQARLGGADDDQIEHLLAIRVTWEWLLFADAPKGIVPAGWAAQWGQADRAIAQLQQAQRTDWLLQSAAEIAYQQPLVQGLSQPQATGASGGSDAFGASAPLRRPAVQALFCIDVRSEVFRRALEFASPAVQTRGFAGFFGLFIAYSPLGSALERPQLPGLLAPAQCVTEDAGSAGLGQVLATQRRHALQWRQRWAEFRAAPASAFSFVESMGLLYGGKLLADSLPSTGAPARWEDTGLPAQAAAELRPCLPQARNDPAAAAAMAKGILGAMGLVDNFAPLVLLAGHGSQSANNPHAAGLDCGACGGQTGEVNARVLADMLNTAAVREHLRALGVDIPADTHFLPALHNTTTDQVLLYDTHAVPTTLATELAQLRAWLDEAGGRARAERADSLGLGTIATNAAALKQAVLERANDWAQVRPEWGLADCAAFIVAPRSRTKHLNLAGRSFLHDYDHRLDPDLGVLTLIMTAPMVVTHWINLQYHASTVDNRRYGSGNKVLHNVVGGHLGVFEGNGGDLRIGLPLQSLHDGHTLRHTPLRLSVFIEAPQAAIDHVMSQHDVVRHLVGNGWLHLFRIDPDSAAVQQYRHGGWATAGAG